MRKYTPGTKVVCIFDDAGNIPPKTVLTVRMYLTFADIYSFDEYDAGLYSDEIIKLSLYNTKLGRLLYA